jgi:hypothetical protein
MPLTFKLSFEHFDFNDEEFLNDLQRVYHYYNNFVVLEYKENKQKVSKEFDSIDDTIKYIDEHTIQFGNLILYNLDIPTLKQKFKERNL